MSIHIERTGGPPDLPAAFAHFVTQHLGGRSLDDQRDEEAKRGKFPDFACHRDLVLIEMKHLEAEQNERINETYKNLAPPEEQPIFYGKRRTNFDGFSNSDEIKAAVLSKLARTIEAQLSKANRQFEDYRKRNPRKNSLSICLLLNSKIDEFSPDVVLYAVHKKIQPPPASAEPRFPHIDAVVYISEKHAQRLVDGRIAFGIVQMMCAPAMEQRWKIELVERITQAWSKFRTGGASVTAHPNQFESVVDIPPMIQRDEARRLAYSLNPYLRGLTNQQLKIHFHRCVGHFSLSVVIGSWATPSPEQHLDYGARYGDAIDEINHRGIDMRAFDPETFSPQDRRQAYAGLPEELVQLLSGQAS